MKKLSTVTFMMLLTITQTISQAKLQANALAATSTSNVESAASSVVAGQAAPTVSALNAKAASQAVSAPSSAMSYKQRLMNFRGQSKARRANRRVKFENSDKAETWIQANPTKVANMQAKKQALQTKIAALKSEKMSQAPTKQASTSSVSSASSMSNAHSN